MRATGPRHEAIGSSMYLVLAPLGQSADTPGTAAYWGAALCVRALFTFACASVDGDQAIGSIVEDRILSATAPPVSRGQAVAEAVAVAVA